MDVIAAGLHVPEGPAVLPDGSFAFTEQTAGRISRVAGAGVEVVAVVGGAPNSCVVGQGGALYVCQNGGVVGAWRSPDPRTPSIQRVDARGQVSEVASDVDGRPLIAPNDLVFGADGTLYFTDPSQPFDPARPQPSGALLAIDKDGGRLVADVGGVYPNGVALAPDGSVLWVESYTRRVRRQEPDGELRTLCVLPEGHVPDGFAVAEDGRLFIASCTSHGVSVVGPDGTYLGLIRLDADANPTNCCFAGGDLVVTDFGMDFETRDGAGRLWLVPTDARGGPVHSGAL